MNDNEQKERITELAKKHTGHGNSKQQCVDHCLIPALTELASELSAAHQRDLEQVHTAQKAMWRTKIESAESCIDQLRSTVAAHQREVEEAKREALGLANSLWRLNYQDEAPEWKPLDTTAGIISQIDNMIAGISQQRDQLRTTLAEKEDYISRLPANWFEDSSLETWFPITAQTLAEKETQLDDAKATILLITQQRDDQEREHKLGMQRVSDHHTKVLAEKEREVEELKDKLSRRQMEADDLYKINSDINAERDALRQQVEELEEISRIGGV